MSWESGQAQEYKDPCMSPLMTVLDPTGILLGKTAEY